MTHTKLEISARTGDEGQTVLGTGTRVGKNSAPIEALGAIDELNGWIGVFVSLAISPDQKEVFTWVQHDLFDLGTQISAPGTPLLSEAHVTRIQKSLDRITANLDMSQQSVLPGGVLSASFGHLARSVCRRAERQLVNLTELEGMAQLPTGVNAPSPTKPNFGLCYLNRLSDLLLVASRLENQTEGRGDTLWEARQSLRN
jgi:cob(I)alamin adenosyltransferase